MTLAIFDDLRKFLEDRAPEIAHAAAAVEAVDNDGAVQAIQAAAGFTPQARHALALFIGAIDAEFTRVARESSENGHAAGKAAALAELAPPPDESGEPQPDPPA